MAREKTTEIVSREIHTIIDIHACRRTYYEPRKKLTRAFRERLSVAPTLRGKCLMNKLEDLYHLKKKWKSDEWYNLRALLSSLTVTAGGAAETVLDWD